MNIYTLVELVEKCSNQPQPWLDFEPPEPIPNFQIDYDLEDLGPIPGPDHDEATIELIREKVTESWENAEERKQKLILYNKTEHSKKMKDRWQIPTEKMLNRKVHGRPKGAKDLTARKKRPERRIYIKGKIYYNAFEAADDVGIHPVNVRRRCRLDEYNDWYYL